MVSCVLHYRIDPYKLDQFEAYANMWLALVERFGGRHRGYFLPSEGANDVAIAIFDFDTLADYERYRTASLDDPDCVKAHAFARETRCILSYERSFMRPIDPDDIASPAAQATGTDDASADGGTDAAIEADPDVIDFQDRKDDQSV